MPIDQTMSSELHSSDPEESIDVAAYAHHSVHRGGFATYDYDRRESPAPSFEITVAYKTIDHVYELDTSTMSGTAAAYIDYPGPTHEVKYLVCCDEQTSINNVRFPWHWPLSADLRSLGLNEVCVANIVHQVRRRSDRFFRSHIRFDSGRVIIPVIVVSVELLTESLENGFRSSDSDYGSAVERALDVSFLEHQVTTVPASEASLRALERVKVDDVVGGMDGVGRPTGLSGGDDNGHPCAICLDDLIVKDESEDREVELIIRLPCKHLFHEGCIITWLETSDVCPLCRSELTRP